MFVWCDCACAMRSCARACMNGCMLFYFGVSILFTCVGVCESKSAFVGACVRPYECAYMCIGVTVCVFVVCVSVRV